MTDFTRFSLSTNGFVVKAAYQGLVATIDGDGYEATTPYYRIIIHNESENLLFSEPGVAFISTAISDDEGFWSWSNVEQAVDSAVKALTEKDVINLIDYDTY
jgi:hypothetical protein